MGSWIYNNKEGVLPITRLLIFMLVKLEPSEQDSNISTQVCYMSTLKVLNF